MAYAYEVQISDRKIISLTDRWNGRLKQSLLNSLTKSETVLFLDPCTFKYTVCRCRSQVHWSWLTSSRQSARIEQSVGHRPLATLEIWVPATAALGVWSSQKPRTSRYMIHTYGVSFECLPTHRGFCNIMTWKQHCPSIVLKDGFQRGQTRVLSQHITTRRRRQCDRKSPVAKVFITRSKSISKY
jgi:hypothetical protein